MLLLPVWEWLEGEVFNLPATTFGPGPCINPYLDFDPRLDRPEAGNIRRGNLRRYLQSFNAWPEILVIGEAPGWRGCRFSGVPFTSETQLDGRLPFCGERTSLGKRPHSEASATVFWRVMRGFHPRFLVWNSLPLHPHQPGQPLSNRTPSQTEIRLAGASLVKLVALLQPRWVVAVGDYAAAAVRRLGLAAIPVRHPGHGGAAAFQARMQDVFGSEHFVDYNSGTFLAPMNDQSLP